MRSVQLALALCLALGPFAAQARAWKGINPGQATQADVVEQFGQPTKKTKAGSRTVLAYYGEQALEGTRQAQFHLDANGTVQEITVFLTAERALDADSIEGTYGKAPQKTFVEDTFQKVWLYPQQGVTVYFGKDGMVEALSFSPGKGKPAVAPAAAEAPAEPAAGTH
ncbi:MAG: hypothetical protein QM767_00805 [Anaeromyxobacter sp.]